jgi:hypothetical protein
MDDYAKIAHGFRKLVKGQKHLDGILIVADVISVDGQTCTVSYGGFEIDDVRLSAIVDDTKGVLITPKVGTKVLLTSLDGTLENLYVLKAQEFDTVLMQTTQTTFQQDDNGFLIKKGSQSLRGLLLDVVSMIKNLKVLTPAGASSNLITPTPPELIDIEIRIKSLLKDE